MQGDPAHSVADGVRAEETATNKVGGAGGSTPPGQAVQGGPTHCVADGGACRAEEDAANKVGGSTPSRRAAMVRIASNAPAAPSKCPVIDLVAETGRLSTAAPKTRRIAATSLASPAGVLVACALRYPTSCGERPALAKAAAMHRPAPSPLGSGATM